MEIISLRIQPNTQSSNYWACGTRSDRGELQGELSVCIKYIRVYTLYNIESQTHLHH